MTNEKKKGVKLYASGGCVVIKNIWNTEAFSTGGNTRGDITGFSVRSGQRMRKYLRGCEAKYSAMLTLTYPGFFESDGAKVKKHLERFMRSLKCWFGSVWPERVNSAERFSAFWFLEFQERGAPHFHIFVNFLPHFKWVAKTWYQIVNSEDERHLRAGTRTEKLNKGRGGTISYASKYAAKAAQKVAPEGYENLGRFWGVYGNRTVVEASTVVRADKFADVSGNFKKIRNSIKKAVLEKTTIVHVDKVGCEVYFIANKTLFDKIKREIMIIECKVNHYAHIFDCAEVET
jgi:hypothetical protein